VSPDIPTLTITPFLFIFNLSQDSIKTPLVESSEIRIR
jgi:hypothetical protein